jgi:hypothetical protein
MPCFAGSPDHGMFSPSPATTRWSQADLLGLVAQLPSPNLLLGDFNAHHTFWGCRSTGSKGQEVADFLLSSNLCLFNGKMPTYIHSTTGASSSIDLAMGLYLDYSFTVHGDSCGSDHFPVILRSARPAPVSGVQRWKLRRGKEDEFHAVCTLELRNECFTGASAICCARAYRLPRRDEVMSHRLHIGVK